MHRRIAYYMAGFVDAFHQFDETQRLRFFDGNLAAFPRTPNVTAFVIRVDPKDDNVFASPMLDLIRSDLALVRGGDILGSDIMKLVNEQVFIEFTTGGEKSGIPIFSAASIFAHASAQGIATTRVTSFADLPIAWRALKANLPDPTQPLDVYGLERAVPVSRSTTLAWLAIDRTTLALIDVIDSQGNAAATEYLQNFRKLYENMQALCMMHQCAQVAFNMAKGVTTIIRGQISLETISTIKDAAMEADNCSRVRVRIKLYKRWGKKPPVSRRAKDVQDKVEGMQQGAKDKALKAPPTAVYEDLRKRKPSEFATEREAKLNRKKRKDEEWDHRRELACGGKHEADNVFPLNQSDNGSLGNYFGAACAKLCEGTSIEEIVVEYVLPGGPGRKPRK